MKEQSSSYRFIRPLIKLHLGNPSAQFLLMFLCHAANNKTGASWHSLMSIGYNTGLNEKTIRKATKMLEQVGVISCEINRHQSSKRYIVNHDKLLELAEKGQAGRDAYIAAEQDKKATRQQRWLDTKNGVSLDVTETPKTVAVDAKSGSTETPEVALTRRQIGRPNYVIELGNRTNERELEENLISGSQDSRKDRGLTTDDDIQALEQEVSALAALKAEALHDKRWADYQTYSGQLQQVQTRLNIARGRLVKAAIASAA
jgi:Helix-turn-helix domain